MSLSCNRLSYFKGLLLILLLLIGATLLLKQLSVKDIKTNEEIVRCDNDDSITLDWWKAKCFFHNCFEINECQHTKSEKIKIYIYPTYQYLTPYLVQSNISDEYIEILDTIRQSVYYEPLPNKACVFVPSLDTLNQRNLDIQLISKLLHNLPWWNNGTNHLIFSMLPGQYNKTPDFNYDKSMLASAQLTVQSYRIGFDISIPVFNSLTKSSNESTRVSKERRYLLVSLVQLGSDPVMVQLLKKIHQSTDDRVVLLGSCDYCNHCFIDKRCDLNGHYWDYPAILQESRYCLILPGHFQSSDLLDILMSGCVPVIIHNEQLVLPFSEVLDWSLAGVFIWDVQLSNLLIILQSISDQELSLKQIQVRYFYNRYFKSIKAVTMTTLDILNSRVYSVNTPSYEYWNIPYQEKEMKLMLPSNLILPSDPLLQGFTAVILSYNRIDMLFKTIKSVAQAPSLAKIIVIWNNINEAPPPTSIWPVINKPLKVIRAKQNKLSNRFFPYDEIETPAILSLDDDIIMMTSDEIEFGYKTWLEYPNRLVGYPGRLHWYDTTSNYWKYDSEWTNNISVVLTGAAFYHKYYHYQYTYHLPLAIRQWVDNHFNCEDIVFNFMVANITGLPPIKVTPRKRFKCADCAKDGLFTDPSHFFERDQCINLFAKFFNGVPLRTNEYRLDPVLYKIDNEHNQFPNIGKL